MIELRTQPPESREVLDARLLCVAVGTLQRAKVGEISATTVLRSRC